MKIVRSLYLTDFKPGFQSTAYDHFESDEFIADTDASESSGSNNSESSSELESQDAHQFRAKKRLRRKEGFY